MNGLSLLVAFAAVGISVDWETTASGVNAYTIRIEALVVDALRTGSAIETVVKPSERETLRQFRVVVGPRSQQTQRLAATTANEVDYGWSPNDAGGIEYYVQITLERLESLARGAPLECIVHRDVPAIDKIVVFVGDDELPRKLPQGVRSSISPPRDLTSIDISRGGNIAPVSGTETNVGARQYGNPDYGTQGNTAVNVSDSNRGNNNDPQTSQSNLSNNQNYGPQPSNDYGNQGSASANRFGQYGDNTMPVPPLDNSRPADYGYNGNQYALQQEPVNRQQAQQPYSPPLVQTAALPAQPQTSAGAAANPTMDALAAVLALQQKQLEKTKTPEESEKKTQSSKPLILTTLALFASIGANAYLGWLAWSFFWRFRDAASDLSRARSNAFPAGSIAGH